MDEGVLQLWSQCRVFRQLSLDGSADDCVAIGERRADIGKSLERVSRCFEETTYACSEHERVPISQRSFAPVEPLTETQHAGAGTEMGTEQEFAPSTLDFVPQC